MESTTQPNKRTVYGYIYRISHPKLWTMTDENQPHQLCYIGRTEKTVAERFKGHLRDAKKFKGGIDGDGKLHAVMSANGFSGFIVEELDSAKTAEELAQKEAQYQKEYDSINNGWNKIIAPSTINKLDLSAVQISLDGKESSYSSVAHLCRELGIQNSTLTLICQMINSLGKTPMQKAHIKPTAAHGRSTVPLRNGSSEPRRRLAPEGRTHHGKNINLFEQTKLNSSVHLARSFGSLISFF